MLCKHITVCVAFQLRQKRQPDVRPLQTVRCPTDSNILILISGVSENIASHLISMIFFTFFYLLQA